MPLNISRNDIRKIEADAIVDPTDLYLSGSGGTDYLIHSLAGKKLDEECERYIPLETGEAVATGSYDFKNCSWIIHTHGPEYIDGNHDEERLLSLCYRNCLKIATEKELGSIAFPLISSGVFSFPKGRALKIASDTITDYLLDHELDVSLLVYDKNAFDQANRLFTDVRDYLQDHYRPKEKKESNTVYSYSYHKEPRENGNVPSQLKADLDKTGYQREEFISSILPSYVEADAEMPTFEPDESFSEAMIRMIDEKGMYDPDVYKKANIDRKLFNHIKNDRNYRPKKKTAVALAIGMKLDMKETGSLLEKAGYVLSRSSMFDLIIRYCIENGVYDIFRINELLFKYDQETLGC